MTQTIKHKLVVSPPLFIIFSFFINSSNCSLTELSRSSLTRYNFLVSVDWKISVKSVSSLSIKQEAASTISSLNTVSFGDHTQDLEQRHTCESCGKSYSYRKNLSRHIRYECGVEPNIACPKCPYVTKYKSSIRVHMKTQHGVEYSCSKEILPTYLINDND